MADRQISFSPAMVRALLEGRKTQTRRILNPQPSGVKQAWLHAPGIWNVLPESGRCSVDWKAPGYAIGDRLYVREAWHTELRNDDIRPRDLRVSVPVYYEAGGGGEEAIPECAGRFRQGMHMPRWASRITLIVTDVRVQRLLEISEADAVAEGIEHDSDGWRDYQMPATQCCPTARDSFRTLWDSLNAERAPWASNPWVVAVSFTVHQRNIDEMERAS